MGLESYQKASCRRHMNSAGNDFSLAPLLKARFKKVSVRLKVKITCWLPLETIIMRTGTILVELWGLWLVSKGHGSALHRELPWTFDTALQKNRMEYKRSEK